MKNIRKIKAEYEWEKNDEREVNGWTMDDLKEAVDKDIPFEEWESNEQLQDDIVPLVHCGWMGVDGVWNTNISTPEFQEIYRYWEKLYA